MFQVVSARKTSQVSEHFLRVFCQISLAQKEMRDMKALAESWFTSFIHWVESEWFVSLMQSATGQQLLVTPTQGRNIPKECHS